ncbi:MAG: hypothetical protein ACQERU_00885 [Bacteroidota bacterium]
MINFLKYSEIDFLRWDNCINNAINGNIFAYSWYLNILCDEWCGLVMGKYDYVMPVIHKKKFNQNIIYAPVLGPRLGVFSNHLLTVDIVRQFIHAIPNSYRYIEINMNKFNKFEDNSFKIKELKTYEIDLIQPGKKIRDNYTNFFQKELKTAVQQKTTIINGLQPNELINFAQDYRNKSYPKITKADIQQLRMIIAFSIRYNLGEIYGAYDDRNNLIAAAFFLKSKRKVYLMYNAVSKKGEKTKALYLLVDKYIEVHAEKNLTLNLEYICTKQKNEFLTGIGALALNYLNIKNNQLPLYIRLLKPYMI